MIARESLEKSLHRLASAAPFLCLMDDHLLCPDKSSLLDQLEKALVDTRVVGQFRMEGRDEEAALAEQDRLAVQLPQHLHALARVAQARRSDEEPANRFLLTEIDVRLEASDLAPVGVPLDADVHQPEVVPVEDDHPGAG